MDVRLSCRGEFMAAYGRTLLEAFPQGKRPRAIRVIWGLLLASCTQQTESFRHPDSQSLWNTRTGLCVETDVPRRQRDVLHFVRCGSSCGSEYLDDTIFYKQYT